VKRTNRGNACTRAVISIMAIDQMGFSGADVARALNLLTPSAMSKLVFHARNDPALINDVNDVLNAL